MPKRALPKSNTKKQSAKPPAPPTKPEKPEKPVKPAVARAPSDSPFALRLAVFEDVVRRAAQETRALQTELASVRASHTELARRVADVEKRGAAS